MSKNIVEDVEQIDQNNNSQIQNNGSPVTSKKHILQSEKITPKETATNKDAQADNKGAPLENNSINSDSDDYAEEQKEQVPPLKFQSPRDSKLPNSQLQLPMFAQRGSKDSDIQQSEYMNDKIFVPTGNYITQEDRIKNQDKKIQYPKFIIPQKHTMKAIWDILIGFFILYSSMMSPLDIAFEFSGIGEILYLVSDYIILAFFILDVLISLRTTFYTNNNEECIEPKMVAKNYISSTSFIVDLISIIPIAEISQLLSSGGGGSSFTGWFKLLKIFRILRLAKLSRFLQSDSAKTLYQMIKIFMVFIIIYHWLTCIWFYIVKLDYDEKDSDDANIWLPSNLRTLGQSSDTANDKELTTEFYEETENIVIYSYTLYSLIILTLGNDIAPITVGQAIFSILICVAGSFLTAIFFGEIAVLIAKLNAESTLYQNKLEKLELKLKHNNIPKVLQTKVLEYFDFCWEKKKLVENVTDFSLLSIPLQKEIHFHLHRDIIKNVPLFKELDLNEIVWIIQRLKTDIYLPDDFIIREGEVGNEMFFLMDGVAKIVIKNQEDPNKPPLDIYLRKGEYVGEIALIIDSKRTADVQAVDFTICEIFTRESYNQLRQEFPDINKRLKDGLKHYKINKIKDIQRTLKAKFLWMLNDDELEVLIRYYMDDIFCEPNKIILSPKHYSNAIYITLLGKISQLPNNQKSHQIMRQLMSRNKKLKVGNNQGRYIKNFDEQIEDFPQEDEYNEVYLKKKVISPGEFFGSIQYEEFGMSQGIDHFYVSLTGCQLGIFTEVMLKKIAKEQPEIFEKIRKGIQSQILHHRKSETDINIAQADNTGDLKKAVQKVNQFITENSLQGELDDMHQILLRQLNMFEELNQQINDITSSKR